MALPQPPSNEDKLKAFDSVPLFMQSLPGPDESVDDTALSALQSLAYDGTPDDIAENFKSQGNNYFKGKRYREALDFYKQGIDAKPDEPKLLEVLLCNRAACNLELTVTTYNYVIPEENFGSVLRDCASVIELNDRSSKAYYRSVQALLSLDRPDEALDACERCLAFDQSNAAVEALKQKALAASAAKSQKAIQKAEEEARKFSQRARLLNAYKERGLVEVREAKGVSDTIHSPHFENNLPSAALVLPAFFLYPQHAQSDTVAEFYEDTTFGDLLGSMLPPSGEPAEWDKSREYAMGSIAVYAITRRRRLLKVGMKMTLSNLLRSAKSTKEGEPDGLELREGYLQFIIVPKGDAERKWVAEFKGTQG